MSKPSAAEHSLHNYWNDGRGGILLRYCILSYGIAAIEWFLNPQNLLWLFPSLVGNTTLSPLDGPWQFALNIVPFVWLLIVVSGIKKTGWPGLVLVFPIWWAMFWWIMIAQMFFYCATGRDCL